MKVQGTLYGLHCPGEKSEKSGSTKDDESLIGKEKEKNAEGRGGTRFWGEKSFKGGGEK